MLSRHYGSILFFDLCLPSFFYSRILFISFRWELHLRSHIGNTRGTHYPGCFHLHRMEGCYFWFSKDQEEAIESYSTRHLEAFFIQLLQKSLVLYFFLFDTNREKDLSCFLLVFCLRWCSVPFCFLFKLFKIELYNLLKRNKN